MADNRPKYGLRWFQGNPYPMPVPIEVHIATGTNFAVTAVNYALGPGDPVIALAAGGVTICLGAETGAQTGFGVVVGIGNTGKVFNSTKGVMEPSSTVPSGVAYGTNLERQTKVLVVPLKPDQLWECDCDDATTATTLAAYQALSHSNVDLTLAVSGVAGTRVNPRIDISSTNTTNTLTWRIVKVSPTMENQDFSGNFVKLLITPNLTQWAPWATTGL